MNIIAQSGAVVNIYVGKKSADKTALRIARAKIKREQRQSEERKPVPTQWQEHKALAVKVGDRLIDCGLKKRGYNIKMCGTELIFGVCADCGHISLRSAQLCRDRLCPVCNWRLSIKRYATMTRIMQLLYTRHPHATYSLVTLTAANCRPGELKEYVGRMQDAWEAASRQRWARADIIGWARSIEVTYNTQQGTLHPHYHVIVVGSDDVAYKLRSEWLEQCRKRGIKALMKAQDVQDIEAQHTEGASLARAVCETYKYMVKSSDVLEMPLGVLRTFAEGIAGKRLISFGGEIKDIAKELEADLDEGGEQEEEIKICTKCHSQQIDELCLTWSMAANQYYALANNSNLAADIQYIIDQREA
jgi:plasmid rolling circle replication initiator protein Rep